jgi:hypothetical protein
MSRKDYQLLAEAIRKARILVTASATLTCPAQGVGITASFIAEALADDNPAFDAERFLVAAGEM